MKYIKVDNYIIDTPLIDIVNQLKTTLTNGKLREVKAWHEGDDNIVVTCPHHSGGREAHAACNIYTGSNSKIEYGYFRCWVCDEQGSFVKFVSECFDYSEEYAKNWLIKNFGKLTQPKPTIDDNIQLKRKAVYLPKTANKDKFLDNLQSWCPYLAQRKLSRDVCELFKVKYDPTLRQVVFPCYDSYGRFVMAPRRSIDTKQFYIPKELAKPLYCMDYVIKNNISTVLITEGPFDCLTAYTYGYPAIATWGNPSPEQINQLNKSCVKVLYLAFDNDIHGQRFANLVKSRVDPRIIIKEVRLPQNRKDLNELSYEEFQIIMERAKNS